MNSMSNPAALLQRVALSTPIARWLWPPYRYMFTPPQLAFLGRELDRAPVGTALEVGCANGDTTVWLSHWMDAAGTDRPYVAIDTFSGFLSRDIAVEAEHGRDPNRFSRSFRGPTRQRFDHAMSVNGIARVQVISADATILDYAQFAPVAFALIDVDLYRPVRETLERVYPHVREGGVIVVDDCTSGAFEGAFEAYRAFCDAQYLPVRVEQGKLGVIRK
jgi:predicted O-methyltransferase YrrM